MIRGVTTNELCVRTGVGLGEESVKGTWVRSRCAVRHELRLRPGVSLGQEVHAASLGDGASSWRKITQAL